MNQAHPIVPESRSKVVKALVGVLLVLSTACASTSSGITGTTRAIDNMPTLEQLPQDARPWIKVSVRQQGGVSVPEQYRWIYALRGASAGVASGDNLEVRLNRALLDSGRFRVRTSHFGDLEQEMELEANGDLRPDSDAVGGNVSKAQYAIHCTVTDFNYAAEESKSGVSGFLRGVPFLGRIFLGKAVRKATVAITAEITNLDTGEMVNSVEGSGYQISSQNRGAFTIRGVKLSQEEKKDPTMANAIAECIQDLVYALGNAIPPNDSEGAAAGE